ncbi:upf0481 protein [Quercus suber]|uniref:Upf0481 protein n=1 Tax=Quercus suber TaxID=58331 RepID=A0AAW0KIT4_QUESU
MAEAVSIEIQQELNASREIETENTESQKEANISNENKSQYERDIDLLCDNGIIRNYLGDNETATSLVNKLNIHVSLSGINPNHNCIFKELNDFYKKPWHKWKATLRHQYFSTPWRIASTIAAIILLMFTFIQTVCSIIQIVPIV